LTATVESRVRRRRALIVGTFEPDFARNRVIASLLRRSGYEVGFVQQQLWGPVRYALLDQPKLRLAARAVRAYSKLVWAVARAERPDVMFVLYPGYFDIPIVAAIARIRRIPLVFDPFISLHDTVVSDRALRSRTSLVGRVTRLIDKLDCRLADLVLVDTPAHADFVSKLTGVERRRFRVLWLGAQEDIFSPLPGVVPDPRLALFHGTFIPLQGIETIVRAAQLLKGDGIRVRIVGDGQERVRIEALAKDLDVGNVQFVGRLPVAELPREIAAASLCLGIFGTTPKADRVVPNKLFECLAMGRPVVTADTGAIREAFDDEVARVPAGDPEALAEAIRELLCDEDRLTQLAAAGHARFERDYSEPALAHTLARHLDELLDLRESANK
jgi:glycosyltransferase involved in cell wall biosynthesis